MRGKKNTIIPLAILIAVVGSLGFVPIVLADVLLVEPGDTIDGKVLTGVGSITPLNDNKDVAFTGLFSGGDGTFIHDGATSTNSLLAGTGDTIDGKTLTGVTSFPSLNNNGDVAFHGLFSGGIGIFIHDAATSTNSLLIESGDTIDGKTLTAIGGSTSINDNGDVVFGGAFSGGFGIFIHDAGTSTNSLLIESGVIIDGKTVTSFNSNIQLNNNGDVAFFGFFSGGNGIFIHDAGTSTNSLLVELGDTIDGKVLTTVGVSTPLNDNGDVVFEGFFSGGSGIFIHDAGTSTNSLLIESGVIIDGKTVTSFDTPVINDNGDVAFPASFSGGNGIFIHDAATSTNSLLIESGDTIDGKTITSFFSPSLNNNKDVAFRGFFSGVVGIFLIENVEVGPPDTPGGGSGNSDPPADPGTPEDTPGNGDPPADPGPPSNPGGDNGNSDPPADPGPPADRGKP